MFPVTTFLYIRHFTETTKVAIMPVLTCYCWFCSNNKENPLSVAEAFASILFINVTFYPFVTSSLVQSIWISTHIRKNFSQAPPHRKNENMCFSFQCMPYTEFTIWVKETASVNKTGSYVHTMVVYASECNNHQVVYMWVKWKKYVLEVIWNVLVVTDNMLVPVMSHIVLSYYVKSYHIILCIV